MIPTIICQVCGLAHSGTDAAADRKTWPLNEATRARFSGRDRLPPEVVGAQPPVIGWSLYAHKEAQSCKRFSGSLRDLASFLAIIGQRIEPEKSKSPVLCGLSHLNARSTDDNAEAITYAWYDCDEAGPWDALRDALERSGVAAIFNESSKRKSTRWHVRIPLVTPIHFPLGNAWMRRVHKLAHRHVAAVLSALAGFGGVGGHCGFDLAGDRLLHPQYPALKRTADDQPARIEIIEGGALDWFALLATTGFNIQAAIEANDKGKPKNRVAVRLNTRPGEPYVHSKGPVGKALEATGMLGKTKDAQGVHAACPFSNLHTHGKGEWDAIYYPATDRWWCPHKSCHRKRAPELISALPAAGKAAYNAALAKGKTTIFTIVDQKKPSGHTRDWVQVHLVAADDPEMFARSLTGAMLRHGFSEQAVVAALAPIESAEAATNRSRSTFLRLAEKEPVAGASWLRRNFGDQAVLNLVEALHKDLGGDPVAIARSFLGAGLIRGEEAQFRRDLHNELPDDSRREDDEEEDESPAAPRPVPIRKAIIKPTGCCRWGDKKYFVDNGQRTDLHTAVKVCEQIGCPSCFFTRLAAENELLEKGWIEPPRKPKKNEKRSPEQVKTDLEVERLNTAGGWQKKAEKPRGPYHFFYVERLKDTKAVDLVLKRAKAVRVPKTKVIGAFGGELSVVVATDDAWAAAKLPSELALAARMNGATFRHVKFETWQEALAAFTFVRVALHVYERSLASVDTKKQFVEFLRWRKGKHTVTKSKTGLPFPSRAAIRAAIKAEKEDEEDPEIPEGASVGYAATHLPTGIEVHQQEYPHTLYWCVRFGSEHGDVKRIESDDESDSDEAAAAQEAAYWRDVAREHALGPPV